jgi:hypothetical protein
MMIDPAFKIGYAAQAEVCLFGQLGLRPPCCPTQLAQDLPKWLV